VNGGDQMLVTVANSTGMLIEMMMGGWYNCKLLALARFSWFVPIGFLSNKPYYYSFNLGTESTAMHHIVPMLRKSAFGH
jgi:hypothetical protein